MMLSEHFSLEEMTLSQTAVRKAIDNTPSQEVIESLKVTAIGLDRIRSLLNYPIRVSSGYRSVKLNTAIGGVPTSQHCKGEAVDFTCPEFGTPLEVCQEIVAHATEIGFDQLIQEGQWTHVSFSEQHRNSVLTANFTPGKPTTYTKGLS